MTRRETLVAVLRGTNNYSLSQLNAMNKVSGVQNFLEQADAVGITHKELADRLVAFKKGGGSGLANAIYAITPEFTQQPEENCEEEKSALRAIQEQLAALSQQVADAIG